MGNLWPIRNDVLALLCEHPFLSRRQIELYLGLPERTVRQGLRELELRKWVWQTNARQAWMHTRCIYAPTQAGVTEVARNASLPYAEYQKRIGFGPERLGRLVLTMEHVFQLRTFFLWLAASSRKHNLESWRWRAAQWDIEVGKLFSSKGRAAWIPFHGAALMQRGTAPSFSALLKANHVTNEASSSTEIALKGPSPEERWAFVVVEFDLSRVPVERDRERLDQFVASQDDPRYWGQDKEQFFPILLVIAQDELRLQDYYNVLRSAALTRQLPMPRAYLTTFKAMLSLRNDNALPIWYSTISGQRTSLLADTPGVAGSLPEQTLWRKLPLNQAGVDEIDPGNIGVTLAPHTFRSAGVASELNDAGQSSTENIGVIAPELNEAENESAENTRALAQIALSLQPLDKRILDEIAAHPLLTRKDLIVLLQVSRRWVQPGLTKLMALKLVQVQDAKYLIAPKGQKYLALTAGFGHAVRRYGHARGWGKGFDTLIRHGKHTEQENKFFLHLAKVAVARGHTFTWLSELESRLYYEAGQRRHSFLPDGRGSYIAGGQRYEFAVEIDRSRSPQERFRRKLAEYEACISSNVLRSEGIELLRLLVLTNSWERADTWCRAVQTVQARFPIFITTFDRVYASGADAPIWLRGDELAVNESAAAGPKVHCFECFAKPKPKPKPKR